MTNWRSAIRAAAPLCLAAGIGATSASAACPAPDRVTGHVVLVSIDGLRPDAIERYGARTLMRIAAEGAYTPDARTIQPSLTLPSHTSMLTGVSPALHGITWNDDSTKTRGTVTVPTIFELARACGSRTAAFFAKSKFRHLMVPGTLDHAVVPGGGRLLMAGDIVEAVADRLSRERPHLLFVHIAEPDYAGHAIGWMSFVYGWAVRRADGALTKLIELADAAYGKGNYTLLVTSDHGGHGRRHGTTEIADVAIPWIAWGRGVHAGRVLPPGVRTMDTGATVLWLLGIGRPAGMEGVVVHEAFEAGAGHDGATR